MTNEQHSDEHSYDSDDTTILAEQFDATEVDDFEEWFAYAVKQPLQRNYVVHTDTTKRNLVTTFQALYPNRPHGSIAQFCREHNIKVNTFSYWLNQDLTPEAVTERKKSRGRPAVKLNTAQVISLKQFITQRLQEGKIITFKEITAHLKSEKINNIARSTVYSIINRLGYVSHKARIHTVKKGMSEQDRKEQVVKFKIAMAVITFILRKDRLEVPIKKEENDETAEKTVTIPLKFDATCVYVMDETAFIGDNFYCRSFSEPSQDSIISMPVDKKRTTLIACYRGDGEKLTPMLIDPKSLTKLQSTPKTIITTNRGTKGNNSDIMKKWVDEVFIPQSKEYDILVMDNLRCHKNKEVLEALREKKRYVLYIPPYSCEASPCDNSIFSVFKRLWKNFVLDHPDSYTLEEKHQWIINTHHALSSNMITNCFKHCNLDAWNYSDISEYISKILSDCDLPQDQIQSRFQYNSDLELDG